MLKRSIIDLKLKKDDRTDDSSLNLRKKNKNRTRFHYLKN